MKYGGETGKGLGKGGGEKGREGWRLCGGGEKGRDEEENREGDGRPIKVQTRRSYRGGRKKAYDLP